MRETIMEESTNRVFFAITLDDLVKHSISNQIELLKKSCHFQVRWVKDTQLHLTLRFLGNVTQDQIDNFNSYFHDLENAPAFDLELQQVIAFPINKPRVIGIGIRLNECLMNVVDLLEKKLTEFGFEPEQRNFLPHITLGRIAKPRRKSLPFAEFDLLSKQRVNHITLFKSQLTPDGSIYTVLKEFKLKSS